MNVARIIYMVGSDRKGEDGPLSSFAQQAKNIGFSVRAILDEDRLDKSPGADQRLSDLSIPFIVSDNFDVSLIPEFERRNAIVLSVNCQWIFHREQIESLDGMIFNYHNADLPRFRGGAAHSWRVLMGETETSLTFHYVNPEVDAGEPVVKIPVIDKSNSLEDFYKSIRTDEARAFELFLEWLSQGRSPLKHEAEYANHFYWPKINSEIDALLDWTWTADEIGRFCKAMGRPNMGALAYLGKHEARVFSATPCHEEAVFHPFQFGLIYRKDEDSIRVATKGGGIKIPLIDLNTEQIIRVGVRFLARISEST